MFQFPRLTPTVKKLLILVLGGFVVVTSVDNWMRPPTRLLETLWLDSTPGPHWLWQAFTYPFVEPPSAAIHVLVNLVFLWWVLVPFEERYGTRRLAQLCLMLQLAAAVPVMVLGLLFQTPVALYGVAPWLYGVMAASAWTMRHGGKLLLFGAAEITARQLLFALLGLSLFFFVAHHSVAHLFADLVSIGGGVAFATWMSRPSHGRPRRSQPAPGKPLRVIRGGRADGNRGPWLN